MGIYIKLYLWLLFSVDLSMQAAGLFFQYISFLSLLSCKQFKDMGTDFHFHYKRCILYKWGGTNCQSLGFLALTV